MPTNWVHSARVREEASFPRKCPQCKKTYSYRRVLEASASSNVPFFQKEEGADLAYDRAVAKLERLSSRWDTQYRKRTYGIVCPHCMTWNPRAWQHHFPKGVFPALIRRRLWKILASAGIGLVLLFLAPIFVRFLEPWLGEVMTDPAAGTRMFQQIRPWAIGAFIAAGCLVVLWATMHLIAICSLFRLKGSLSPKHVEVLAMTAYFLNGNSVHEGVIGYSDNFLQLAKLSESELVTQFAILRQCSR